ncbi:MAG: type 1 glutamine amidotransferase [Puniceicoccaceae bacterium]
MKRAHCFQHVPFEGLGSIDSWLRSAGFEISKTEFFNSGVPPEIEAVDFLIIMGGPMSVNDGAQHPWIAEEKDFIRKAVAARKPVLGVCLGAQLIAAALGSRVYPNPVAEIGWWPIHSAGADHPAAFRFPAETLAFHWHGDTFDLPPGAVQLAGSAGCRQQAFQYGRNVIGLQFHLETTPASARAITANCRDELVPGPYVQSEAEILSAPPERYSSIHSLMAAILEHLLR